MECKQRVSERVGVWFCWFCVCVGVCVSVCVCVCVWARPCHTVLVCVYCSPSTLCRGCRGSLGWCVCMCVCVCVCVCVCGWGGVWACLWCVCRVCVGGC